MNPALLALILTQAQTGCLNSAYNAGEIYGLAKTFRAVVLVESSGCLHESGDQGESFGAAQIQIYTARQTCACDVNEQQLRGSRTLNLAIGAKFLNRCFAKFWPDKRRSLYCYQAGIPRASQASRDKIDKSKYVAKVLRAIRELNEIKLDDN